MTAAQIAAHEKAEAEREEAAIRANRKRSAEVYDSLRAAVEAKGSTFTDYRIVDGIHVRLDVSPVAAKGTAYSMSHARRYAEGIFAVRLDGKTWRRAHHLLPYAEIAAAMIAHAAALKVATAEENARADRREALREDPRFIALCAKLVTVRGRAEAMGSGLLDVRLSGLTLDQAERVVAALAEVKP